jgi:fermentation-respiration switch protein FrsA (DUF1100 family)
MYLLLSLAVVLAALTALVRWLEPRMAFFPFPGEDDTPRSAGLPFEAVTIETTDGERLRAWAIHGPQPRARIAYSVLAVDYRGYGLSTGRPTERGLYRDVDATVARPWPEAERGLPLVYWGRSLGGAMAAYAATVRKPDGVIIEAGFPDARSAVRGSPVLAVLSLLASYRFPAADFLNLANVPVLQLHGDRDRVIPIELGRELFQLIRGPKAFVVIPGGDHNDAAPQDAAAYWSAIDGFIAARRR